MERSSYQSNLAPMGGGPPGRFLGSTETREHETATDAERTSETGALSRTHVQHTTYIHRTHTRTAIDTYIFTDTYATHIFIRFRPSAEQLSSARRERGIATSQSRCFRMPSSSQRDRDRRTDRAERRTHHNIALLRSSRCDSKSMLLSISAYN